MSIELELTTDPHLMATLTGLGVQEARVGIITAAHRAAVAARAVGSRKVREVYTIKASDLKSKTYIKHVEDGAIIRFRGSPEPVEKFKAQKRRAGVFVAVKRGSMKKVERGFTIGTRFVAREGRERLPIKGLYGPSVPQLYGNPEVMEVMQERGSEVFADRVEHEIEYRLGMR